MTHRQSQLITLQYVTARGRPALPRLIQENVAVLEIRKAFGRSNRPTPYHSLVDRQIRSTVQF